MTVAPPGPSDAHAPSGALYRGMDRPALDAAYNNTEAVADSAAHLASWTARSAVLRRDPSAVLDLPYATGPRNGIDYFPSGAAGAPLFVFLHGGYWQRNSKEIFAFLSEGPVAHGIDVATVGYTLAPGAGLSQIVAEIDVALSHLAAAPATLGFDRTRVYVGGWSAGGHLAAISARHPLVRGVVGISGIYELLPISLCYLDAALHLTQEEVDGLSPMRRIVPELPPQRLFVGADELPELRRQSADYAQACRTAGLDAALTLVPGRDHFSILDELAAPSGRICRALAEMARL